MELEDKFDRIVKILDGLVDFLFQNTEVCNSWNNEQKLSYLASVRHELKGYKKI